MRFVSKRRKVRGQLGASEKSSPIPKGNEGVSMWTQVECRGQIAVGAEVPSTLEQKEGRIPGPEQGQSGGSTKPLCLTDQ